jgi:hypothetical protein
MELLGAIVSLLVVEGPAVIAAVQKALPPLIAFVKGIGGRDAVVVALDAAEAAYRESIDVAVRQKHAHDVATARTDPPPT